LARHGGKGVSAERGGVAGGGSIVKGIEATGGFRRVQEDGDR
jgi:hypothetical protein